MTNKELNELAHNIYDGQELTIFDYAGDVDRYVSDLIELGDENGWLNDLSQQDRIELQCKFEELIEREIGGAW